jgi:hypothetical protein
VKLHLIQLRDKFALVSEILAIGRAFGDGRIATAQAADAISRAGRRSRPRQARIEDAALVGAVDRRDDELVGAH